VPAFFILKGWFMSATSRLINGVRDVSLFNGARVIRRILDEASAARSPRLSETLA